MALTRFQRGTSTSRGEMVVQVLLEEVDFLRRHGSLHGSVGGMSVLPVSCPLRLHSISPCLGGPKSRPARIPGLGVGASRRWSKSGRSNAWLDRRDAGRQVDFLAQLE